MCSGADGCFTTRRPPVLICARSHVIFNFADRILRSHVRQPVRCRSSGSGKVAPRGRTLSERCAMFIHAGWDDRTLLRRLVQQRSTDKEQALSPLPTLHALTLQSVRSKSLAAIAGPGVRQKAGSFATFAASHSLPRCCPRVPMLMPRRQASTRSATVIRKRWRRGINSPRPCSRAEY